MKKITLLFTFLTVTFSFGQNLITNGNFDDPGSTTSSTANDGIGIPGWSGYKNRIVTDNLTSSFVGQGENSDSSMYQILTVTPGKKYDVTFDYRWEGSGGAANTNMIVRVKDELNVTGTGKPNLPFTDASDGFTLNTTVDVWYSGSFSFIPPAGVFSVRVLFFKATTNKPLNLDNVSVTLDATASIEDLLKFNFKSTPNPAKDYINLSASKTIEKIEIYSILGQQVKHINLNKTQSSVDVSSLSNGIYIVKAFIEDAVGTYRFIKE